MNLIRYKNKFINVHIYLWLDKTISYDIEKTEVRELQILRDHSDYLSILCVYGDTIYSSCSDGHIYSHTFPELNNDTVHYDMAYDDEGNYISLNQPSVIIYLKIRPPFLHLHRH